MPPKRSKEEAIITTADNIIITNIMDHHPSIASSGGQEEEEDHDDHQRKRKTKRRTTTTTNTATTTTTTTTAAAASSSSHDVIDPMIAMPPSRVTMSLRLQMKRILSDHAAAAAVAVDADAVTGPMAVTESKGQLTHCSTASATTPTARASKRLKTQQAAVAVASTMSPQLLQLRTRSSCRTDSKPEEEEEDLLLRITNDATRKVDDDDDDHDEHHRMPLPATRGRKRQKKLIEEDCLLSSCPPAVDTHRVGMDDDEAVAVVAGLSVNGTKKVGPIKGGKGRSRAGTGRGGASIDGRGGASIEDDPELDRGGGGGEDVSYCYRGGKSRDKLLPYLEASPFHPYRAAATIPITTAAATIPIPITAATIPITAAATIPITAAAAATIPITAAATIPITAAATIPIPITRIARKESSLQYVLTTSKRHEHFTAGECHLPYPASNHHLDLFIHLSMHPFIHSSF